MFQELVPTACPNHNKCSELAAHVIDSWVPFLEFLFVVQSAVHLASEVTSESHEPCATESHTQNQVRYCTSLLSDLGVFSNILCVLESSAFFDLTRRWCIHLNAAHKGRNISPVPNFVPLTADVTSTASSVSSDPSRKRAFGADSPIGSCQDGDAAMDEGEEDDGHHIHDEDDEHNL